MCPYKTGLIQTLSTEATNHYNERKKMKERQIRGVTGGGQGGIAPSSDFGRIEGAARQRRRAALLLAPQVKLLS